MQPEMMSWLHGPLEKNKETLQYVAAKEGVSSQKRRCSRPTADEHVQKNEISRGEAGAGSQGARPAVLRDGEGPRLPGTELERKISAH